MLDLAERSAIVTGGSRGIGRAIAGALVEAGASVTIAARDEARLAEAAEALSRQGPGRARGQAADVRRHADCRALVQGVVDVFGRLDILVNNAGVGIFAPVAEMEPEDWDRVLRTNLDGLLYCCHEALPHLRRNGAGWIINIGSLAGRHAFPGGAAYNASKFGLIGFSEALMQEVRHDGIRVSTIMPGSVASEFGEARGRSDDWKVQPQDIARMVMDRLAFPDRTLPSRVEVRPSRPPPKS